MRIIKQATQENVIIETIGQMCLNLTVHTVCRHAVQQTTTITTKLKTLKIYIAQDTHIRNLNIGE